MAKLREADMFELPPMEMPFDEEESEGSEIDDDLLSTTDDSLSPDKQWNIDLHSVDVNCEAFKSLPADVRHDILTDLKETRKQSSWGRMHEMPEESNAFSTYQMDRLLKRRDFQVSLEETQKEMGGKTLSLGDLDELLKDQGVTTTLDMGKRIASDSAKRFIYIQEAMKKTMSKPSSGASSSPAFKTPRNTIMHSSRIESKSGNFEAKSLSSNIKVSDSEVKFESDWTSDSGDDESKSVLNTNGKSQAKSRVDLARDFMFVASSLSHEEIHSIVEKHTSPQKSNKNSVNDRNSTDTDSDQNDIASSSKLIHRSNILEAECINYNARSSTSHVDPPLSFPGPSTSRADPPLRFLGPSTFENEIDYIGIISDDSDSDEESDAGETEEEKPLEIVIQCDKEYNIEDDMFADVFCNIEVENKNKLNIIYDHLNSDQTLRKKQENTVNLEESLHNKSLPVTNAIQIDQVRDAISLILPKHQLCHQENQLANLNNDTVTQPGIVQPPKENQLTPASPLEGKQNIDTNIPNISPESDLTSNNSLIRGTSEPYVVIQNKIADKNIISEISIQCNSEQGDTIKHNGGKPSTSVPYINWGKIKIPEVDQQINGTEKSTLGLQHKNNLQKSQDSENQSQSDGNQNDEQAVQSFLSMEESKNSLKQTKITSEPLIENIPTHKENDMVCEINDELVVPTPPLKHLSSQQKTRTALESTESTPSEQMPLKQVLNQPAIEDEIETALETCEPTSSEQIPAGTSTYFPSASKFTTKQLQGIQAVLESQHKDLLMEQGKKERMASNITAQMSSEAQELLKLFGLPYIVAPMEAEAQCAFLDYISLTDGTISDDSDIWLFGGQKVYKNFFNQKKHVMQFTAGDIRQFFKLARHQMILIALLTGSDYTTGLQGVGPVTAMEILAAFPSDVGEGDEVVAESLARGLRKFQEWCSQGRPAGPGKAVLRNKLKDLKLHEGFPSLPVIEAYLRPAVDLSKENFTWALPDVDRLRDFAREKFGWTRLKTDEILLPVMNKLNERISQKSLHSYFQVKVKLPATDGKLSKRVQKAVNRLGTEENLSDEDDPPVPMKKPRRKLNSEPKKAQEGSTSLPQRGRGRGRGRGNTNKATKSTKPVATAGLSSELTRPLPDAPASELIPQRERDRLNALKNKLQAIELFRTSKSGMDPTKRQKIPLRKELASAKLSESDSDDSN